MLISTEAIITCDFLGRSGPPYPPSGPMHSVVYRVLDSRARGRGFGHQRDHCVVSLSKTH